MSTYDRIKAEGIEQGIEQGVELKEHEFIKNL